MNPRIKELALDAGAEFWQRLEDGVVKENAYVTFDPPESLEKFAELIIKECIAQIEVERGNPYRNIGDGHEYGVSACDESIRRIKEHFGVEE